MASDRGRESRELIEFMVDGLKKIFYKCETRMPNRSRGKESGNVK